MLLSNFVYHTIPRFMIKRGVLLYKTTNILCFDAYQYVGQSLKMFLTGRMKRLKKLTLASNITTIM